MINTTNVTAATSSGDAETKTLSVTFPPLPPTLFPEPMRGLFDVEVYGLREFSLIPKNDLARELAGTWLHGDLKTALHMCGVREPSPGQENTWEKRRNVVRLSLRLDVPPLLTSGGDPFYTGQTISKEEHVVALAAIEAHRAALRPKPRATPKRKRAK